MADQARREELGRAAALRAAMLELLHSPGWEAYSRELEEIESRLTERLVSAGPKEFAHIQGQIVGLRAAHFRPKQIIESTPV